jgi:hypothetical protein
MTACGGDKGELSPASVSPALEFRVPERAGVKEGMTKNETLKALEFSGFTSPDAKTLKSGEWKVRKPWIPNPGMGGGTHSVRIEFKDGKVTKVIELWIDD